MYAGTIRPASTLNNRREITGWYQTADQVFHGYVYCGGEYTTIEYPGALYTQAFGINSHGDIVGRYNDAAGLEHGFLRIEDENNEECDVETTRRASSESSRRREGQSTDGCQVGNMPRDRVQDR